MAQPIQIYLGVPQTSKLPVYNVTSGQQITIKQVIFSNTAETDSKITLTVSSIDIMKDYVVKAGETQIVNMNAVLEKNNTLFLQQEKANAINVLISGELDQLGSY
ncbi:hypothetical protein [Bacillus cereus group sp. TH253LC]|uniref:hypothetical protein n=1 Tax=Bacillus cereus group sp. TH253LC TaxID=3018043 RepID=UPI0022E43CE9|nr:hypothetical protein [Bacillus cereus group sp. TH253LC]MDA1545868.1 hypothetical protein [Bacillus cereus group sp. TH253LC]